MGRCKQTMRGVSRRSTTRAALVLGLSAILALGVLPTVALADDMVIVQVEQVPEVSPENETVAVVEEEKNTLASDTEDADSAETPCAIAEEDAYALSVQDSIASGMWGTCPWEIASGGKLTVWPGTGATPSGSSSGGSSLPPGFQPVYTSAECPWKDYADTITSVAFARNSSAKVIFPENSSCLFEGLAQMRSADLANADTSGVTNMANMFSGCSSLSSLNLSGWDTRNVGDTINMFSGCTSLIEVSVGANTTVVSDVALIDDAWRWRSQASGETYTSWQLGNRRGVADTYTRADTLVFATISPIPSQTYTGSTIRPMPSVTLNGKKLELYTDYVLTYKNNVNVGTATVVVTGRGDYRGAKTASFQIVKPASPAKAKVANPIKAKAVLKSASYTKLKKKSVTVARPMSITGAKGGLTYAKVSKGSSKRLSVNKKTGKVTVKKGTKKGTYKIKIRVTAAGDAGHNSGSKTVTCKVKVK